MCNNKLIAIEWRRHTRACQVICTAVTILFALVDVLLYVWLYFYMFMKKTSITCVLERRIIKIDDPITILHIAIDSNHNPEMCIMYHLIEITFKFYLRQSLRV